MSSISRQEIDNLVNKLKEAVEQLRASSAEFKSAVGDLDTIVTAVGNSYNTNKGQYVKNDLSSLNLNDLNFDSTLTMYITCTVSGAEVQGDCVGHVEKEDN